MKKQAISEVKQFKKIAGLLKEDRDVIDGVENIFLKQDYIQELQEIIDSLKNSKIQSALLVYVAALEDAWRSFDDDVDSRNPDFEDIWHNLDYGKAISNGQVVSYADAEKKLKSLDPNLQGEVWDLFLDGKQEYYEGLREGEGSDSESDDTDAMGGINEEDSQLTAEEVKDTLLTADLTPEEMKKCRISDTADGYVEFRYGYWEGHIPRNIANALEAHFDVKQNDVDSDEGRLYYYELRPKQDISRVNEAGNIKGIKIEIPGNSYASDFGKAAAREVIESFGPREYRNFLEAFLNEFKKLTGGV